MPVRQFHPSLRSRAKDVATLNALSTGEAWIQLQPPQRPLPLLAEAALPSGSGFVIASGGSTGGQGVCLQPTANLDASAQATAGWLQRIGINPRRSVLLNPLPLHHISGLMPWWRSRVWGAQHVPLEPSWLKQPELLSERMGSFGDAADVPRLLSLVPTQLIRLMEDPDGLACLKRCAVIWVGGAGLASAQWAVARGHRLNLAPCYGATETAAMVTALPPQDFLEGMEGCGDALGDVELRLDVDGGLMVRTQRLAAGRWNGDPAAAPVVLRDRDGWWRSGDLARWLPGQGAKGRSLQLIGRRDAVINSGGETLFLESLEERMGALFAGLPVQSLLLVGVPDVTWGEKLVGLVRWNDALSEEEQDQLLPELCKRCLDLSACERPKQWLHCSGLAVNAAGKWERPRWAAWAARPRSTDEFNS